MAAEITVLSWVEDAQGMQSCSVMLCTTAALLLRLPCCQHDFLVSYRAAQVTLCSHRRTNKTSPGGCPSSTRTRPCCWGCPWTSQLCWPWIELCGDKSTGLKVKWLLVKASGVMAGPNSASCRLTAPSLCAAGWFRSLLCPLPRRNRKKSRCYR